MQFRGSHKFFAGFVLFTLLVTVSGGCAWCQDTVTSKYRSSLPASPRAKGVLHPSGCEDGNDSRQCY